MNKQNFRVIFNQNRGLSMVVAENVASQGKGTGAGSAVTTTSAPLLRFAHLAVAVAMLCCGVTFVQAQIVADPNAGNRRPAVTTTASGMPLVNIVAPNSSGLSHNQYTSFNVGSGQGVILNNSPTIVQTQQAGYVSGNPNLTNGSASIILNEVTGVSRSQLNGYIEVAGQTAQVIVANPNGLSVDGGGFINASRGVLTTGTPVLGSDGSLSAFRVTGGDIQINGGGLNGSSLTQMDLIARSVAVNTQLWATNLNVVVGTNQVSYADLGVQVIAGDNNKPTVGIDIAQLGGMYANKIKLVGTEAGVGVAAFGNIASEAGDLNIDNQGQVTLKGQTNASGLIRIVGNDGISNTGTLSGQQTVQLYSAGQIANSGAVTAQSDLTLFSGSINSTGVLASGIDVNGHATQAGSISMTAAGAIAATGQNTAGTDIEINGTSVSLAHAQTNAGGNVGLAARAGDIDLTGSTLQATGSATISGTGAATNDQGNINVSQLTINSASLSNIGGKIVLSGTGNTSITTTGALNNNSGAITTNGQNLAITSGSIDNSNGQINHAGSGTATIQSGEVTNAQGAIASNGQINLTASSLNNQGGQVTAAGAANVTVSGAVTNDQGTVQSGGALALAASSLDNTAGSIKSLNTDGLTLTTSGQLTNAASGVIGGNGRVDVKAGSLTNSSTISAAQDLALTTGQALDNSSGTLAAGGHLTGNVGSTLTNDAGTIAGAQVTIGAHDIVNQGGLISQSGTAMTAIQVVGALNNAQGKIQTNADDLAITSGSLTNDSGTISQAATGTLNIDTGALSNQKGAIATNGAAVIIAGATTNSGSVTAQQALSITATSLNNNGGSLASNAALTVNAGSQLTNSGGTIQAGSTANPSSATVTATTLDNSNGVLGAGTIDLEATTLHNAAGQIIQNNANGTATINASQLLDNDSGMIGVVARNLSLVSQAISNDDGGSIAHVGTGTLTVQTGALSNDGGVLGTNGAGVITTSSIANQGGKLTAVGNESVTSTGNIDNSQAGYVGGAAVAVTAGQINNQNGTIEGATAGAIVNAQSVNNSAGKIQNLGTGAVTVTVVQALNNAAGSISGGGALTATAGSISNAGGAIGALGNLNVSSGTNLDNTNGALEGMGNVSTTALGAVTNVGGKIEALGSTSNLQVSGSTVDNTNAKIINVGTGLTTINGTTSITNANPSGTTGTGLIGGAGDVAVNTPALSNVQGAHIVAGDALRLNATNSLDNSSGQLLATGALTMNQPGATLTNVGGGISGGSVALSAASIDNTNGTIANPTASGGGIGITTGTLTNTGGAIGSDVDLTLTANALVGNGKIVAGRDGNVSLQGDYVYDSANQITANRNLTFSNTGTLTNTGTLSATGNITVNAANVVNEAGADIVSGNPGDLTTGTTTVNAGAGNITNVGRIEGNTVNTTSNLLSNTGTLIGNTVTANANTLTNDGAAAIIAGANQVNLWVTGTVNNQNGATLYSLGDLNMAANGAKDANGYLFNQTATINNLSSTIEADGTMNVAANQINNVRQNVQVNTVTVSDTTTTMTPSSWWTSLRPQPDSANRTVNSNIGIQDAYYLNPTSIVSITPVVTPDGYLVYKAVVNLSASDSVFEWMQSGLTYALPNGGNNFQYGSQSRVTATAGTQVIYFTASAYNQINPDQVAGNSAWSEYNNSTVNHTLATISYSNQYGNCTTNCVRLETYKGYTDPSTTILSSTFRGQADVPGGYPVEVQRIANQTVTETQLAATSGAPAQITSGGAMHMAIGTQLSNNNGQIAAGGNLTIDGVASADGSNNTKIVNTATQLTMTYSSVNQSGFGSADYAGSVPVQWATWTNPAITQNIGVVGGTITSNQAVSITGGQITNTSVGTSTRPIGQSAASLGLGDGIAPLSLATNNAIGGVPTANQSGVTVTTPVTNGGSTSTPGASRTVDGARAGIINTVLPTNGLYHVEPLPSQPYLIQTDPRFTQYGNFISSDYMLNLLGINPAATEKRLGDGFYEEQLVDSQVTNLTGQKYLTGYTSAEDEYKALMTSGAQVAEQFNLQPGMALTDAEMASLTSNIVWLVNQTVTLPDGTQQTVLVPQVYLAQNMDLSPTGALIAGSSVAVQGTDITNTGGTISGTQQLLLAADHDISNIGGTLSGGNVALLAGNNILDQSVTNTAINDFGNSSSTITAVGAVGTIAATQNLVMSAGQDLTLQGAQVGAAGNATLTAGNAIDVDTVSTGSQYAMHTAQGNTTMQSTEAVGSTVNAGGNLGLVATGDLTVTGSALSSGQNMLVAAGGNVTIQNATDSNSYHTDGQGSSGNKQGTQVIDEHSQTAVGSSLTAGGNATVLAGAQETTAGGVVLAQNAPAKDLILTASTVAAGTNPDGQGNAVLGATGNVTENAAMLHNDFSQDDQGSHHGFMSSGTNLDVTTMSANVAQGSTVSGNQVQVSAGKDVTVSGSGIAATSDLTVNAGGNVNIVATQNNEIDTAQHQSTKSGLMGSGGIGFTIGDRSQDSTQTSTTVTNTGSTIGSINGNVNITAGNTYNQSGSNVIAMQGDIGITAQKVNVVAVNDTSSGVQSSSFNQSGLSLSVSAPIITAAQGIQQMATASSQSGDARMKVLAGAAAASTAYNAYGAASNLAATNQSQATGVTISLTLGGSSSNSQSTQSSSTVVGSTVKAGGNVSITATGAGQNSDINVIGSNVAAGQNTLLKADGDINLKAAQSSDTQQSTSSSSSGAVGIAATYGQNGWAFGITASASGSRGNGNGTDVTNVNSNVTAGNTLVLSSGHDTNIQGAVASGNQVFADVGTSGQGNLNIQSLQDTSTYNSKDQSIGGTVTIGYGASGSGSASQSKVNGTYASVGQQSGIKAGDGGFVVNVNGNTDLNGGVIASTAVPANNLLVTQTLTQSNIQNNSSYSASSENVGGGYGVSSSSGGGGTAQGSNILTIQQGGQGSSAGVSSKSGSSSGTSYGGVSAGTIDITNSQQQQQLTGQTAAQAIAAVNNNVGVTNAGSISQGWNGQQLNTQVTANAQIVAAFGQQAATQIGRYADTQRDDLTAQATLASENGDPDQAASLLAQAALWDEGGAYRTALHTGVGALTGGVGGAAGALVSSESMAVIGDAIAHMGLPLAVTNGLQQVAAAALGAVVGGGAGAASSLNIVANNLQLDAKQQAKLQELIAGKSLSDQQDMVDAACALVKCSAGVPTNDPDKENLVEAQQAGQQNTALQQQLIATGLFPQYGTADAITDALTSYQVSNRATGAVQGVTYAAIAAGAITGGCATIAACGLGALVAGTSLDYSYTGFQQAVSGNPTSTYGQQVLQSFGVSSNTAALAYGALNVGAAIGGAALTNIADSEATAFSNASRLSYSTGTTVVENTGANTSAAVGEGAAGTSSGSLTGRPTVISPNEDPSVVRSLTRENDSATTLADNGYQVEQNPPTLPNGKNPDYVINGQVFDAYSPSTSSVRNAASEIGNKVSGGQTNNVVVNLTDSTITPAQLQNQLNTYPIPGLQQVIAIDQSGKVVVIKLSGK